MKKTAPTKDQEISRPRNTFYSNHGFLFGSFLLFLGLKSTPVSQKDK